MCLVFLIVCMTLSCLTTTLNRVNVYHKSERRNKDSAISQFVNLMLSATTLQQKNPLMYSFSGKSAASATISTFMYLWAIYVVPGLVYNTYFLQQNRQTDCGNIWITHRRMNVEIGTETPIFLFWEYLFRNFCILSLQCIFTTEAKC